MIRDDLNHFLIVRNDRLGDAILALPVVTALGNLFPNARISFLASPYTAPLIEYVEGISRVFKADDRHSGLVTKELLTADISCAVCLRPTLSNAVALAKAQIPIRIGTAFRAYSLLFTDRIQVHRKGQSLHETDLNLALIARFGEILTPPFPKITLPLTAIDKARNIVCKANQPIVILHPGSGGSARDWHIENFKILAKSFQQMGWRVISTGSSAEREKCSLIGLSPDDNLAGQTDILTLAAVLRSADLVIANSTGPLHLANALGTPVLGLYPPVADCLPSRWGPYGHPEMSLTPDLPLCRKCHPGSLSLCWCMEQLSPDIVYNKAMEIVSSKTADISE